MNESSIRKYANLMNELGLTGLEIKEDDCVVRLERITRQESSPNTVPINTVPAKVQAEPLDHISVLSTMVGIFYSSPTENAEPFVKVGDTVKKGSTLCIIEAMKLMNEITAEQEGIITEICVQNGQVVDYGCELLRMKRL